MRLTNTPKIRSILFIITVIIYCHFVENNRFGNMCDINHDQSKSRTGLGRLITGNQNTVYMYIII